MQGDTHPAGTQTCRRASKREGSCTTRAARPMPHRLRLAPGPHHTSCTWESRFSQATHTLARRPPSRCAWLCVASHPGACSSLPAWQHHSADMQLVLQGHQHLSACCWCCCAWACWSGWSQLPAAAGISHAVTKAHQAAASAGAAERGGGGRAGGSGAAPHAVSAPKRAAAAAAAAAAHAVSATDLAAGSEVVCRPECVGAEVRDRLSIAATVHEQRPAAAATLLCCQQELGRQQCLPGA